MACLYCGIPLALETPSHDSFVSGFHDFKLDKPTQNDGYAGTDTEYLKLPFQNPKEALPEIGVLTWPRGASRCATFYAVVGGDQLELIRTAVDANDGVGDLILSDGNSGHTITAANMRMLPPLPIHKIGALAESGKLYLLTLVDQRYDWREKAVVVSPTDWTSLIQDIAVSLGITIDISVINPDYQTASVRWTQEYKPAPALLDAALASVGQKLVVGLDGSVYTVKWSEAVTESELQFDTIKTIIGGQIEQTDLTRIVPRAALVTFGKVIGGVLQDDPYTVLEQLVDLAVPGFDGVTGVAVNTVVINADYIYDATSTNITNCDAVAFQTAYDWYGWHLASLDFTAPGIWDWVPTGAEDLIEWHYQYGGSLLTRIVRGPFQTQERGGWNPAIPYREPLVRVIAASSGTGEYTHRYTVRQVAIDGSFNLNDVTVATGFIQWYDVVEIMNRTVAVSTAAVPEQGVYTLHLAPDGHYYIDADAESTGSGSSGGGSGSGGGNSCSGCFPGTGSGDGGDPIVTVDVLCIDGVIYVIYARQGIYFDASTGRVRLEYYDITYSTAGCCDCATTGSGSGTGSGGAGGGGGGGGPGGATASCCSGTIPSDIYLHLSNVSGCPNADSTVIHLYNPDPVGLDTWSLIGATGNCGGVSYAAFSCATGNVNVVWGTTTQWQPTLNSYACNPLYAVYEGAIIPGDDASCCTTGTIIGILTETP